jgi:hypothetical protein
LLLQEESKTGAAAPAAPKATPNDFRKSLRAFLLFSIDQELEIFIYSNYKLLSIR